MDVSSSALFGYLLDDLREHIPGFSPWGAPDYIPGAASDEVMANRLCHSIFKKLNDEIMPDADKRCLDKFIASNIRCKEWKLDLQSSWEEELFGTFQQVFDEFFYPNGEPLINSYFDLMSRGKCGPGASLGANGVDFYTKLFSSKLTATSPSVYNVYTEYASWFTDWRNGEFDRLLTFGLPRYTRSSNLSFVRKTRDISRSICTEPSLNMFLQLGLGNIIADRLFQSFGIDFSVQPDRNRHLAQVGSRDDSFVTIDLESASDSISVGLMDLISPEYLKDILAEIRTPGTRVGTNEMTLWMVSTMGNGFTFPLQTAIFACIVVASFRYSSRKAGRCDDFEPLWGVFGDDIICPKEISSNVCRLLRILGFLVNSNKSYFEGPFRESCGADFYQGVNVRGVYLKTLRSQQSRYVAINLLNEWSARCGIPLRRSVGYLVDSVRYLAIPPWENQDAGIRSPRPFGRCWQSKKQRYVYRCYYPVSNFLFVRDDRVTGFLNPRKRIKKRTFNPSGLWFSFLGGYIRSSKISLSLKQGDEPSYRMRTKVSPYWGPSAEQLSVAGGCAFWGRWNIAAQVNLSLES